jgi:hypothetical protein
VTESPTRIVKADGTYINPLISTEYEVGDADAKVVVVATKVVVEVMAGDVDVVVGIVVDTSTEVAGTRVVDVVVKIVVASSTEVAGTTWLVTLVVDDSGVVGSGATSLIALVDDG